MNFKSCLTIVHVVPVLSRSLYESLPTRTLLFAPPGEINAAVGIPGGTTKHFINVSMTREGMTGALLSVTVMAIATRTLHQLRNSPRTRNSIPRKRSTSKKPTEPPTPAPLPRDQWKTDAKGRTMTRTCRYCNEWHYDFDCPKRPEPYNLSYSADQFPPKAHESDSETTSSNADTSSGAYSSYSNNSHTYDTYSNGQKKEPEKTQIKVPCAELYTVQSLPSSLATGTGIAYLSAEPCPLKAWIGTSPPGDTPLESGFIDSG